MQDPQAPTGASHRLSGVDPNEPADVHFAVPLDAPGAAATIVAHLALALDAAGVAVSLCPGEIAADVGPTDRPRLEAMMRRPRARRFHVHWSPPPGGQPPAESDGVIHAEFFAAEHGGPCQAVTDLDLPARQVVMNSRRKFTFSQEDKDFLTALGVSADRCVVIDLAHAAAGRKLWQALLRFEEEYLRDVAARTLVPVAAGKVSVIAATYNRPEALKKFFSAYRRQTLPRRCWELILADDCSNYPVAELVREHGAGLPVRLLQNSKNLGAGLTRNRAIPQTTGEVVLFTGDDIIPHENLLAEHARTHRDRDDPHLGVLGLIDWHPDVAGSPMLAYIAGEGGQQFAYYHMKAGHYVGPDNFYTSNVSVRRSLLVGQEELFSHRFAGHYGFEDLELGVRLGRAGMRLLYHPAAYATHLHPMTDRAVLERQYKVGRSCVVFSLLQPGRAAPENWLYMQWLEQAQRHLLRQPAVQAVAGELARLARGLDDCLDAVVPAWQAFGAVIDAFAGEKGRPRPTVDRRQKALFALRLDLATRAGMADEWMGVPAGAPNLVRDLVYLFACMEVWRLFDPPGSATSGQAPPAATLARRMARRLRRHPGLTPLWACLERLPGFSAAESAARGFLRRSA